jgi:3-deoxy-D-manno-octulosonate 8-phosphate phosphatase (KDO 8-P phosphatase)
MLSYKQKLPKITTFIFDVDGVLTDGQVLLMNDDVIRTLNSRDGFALQHASKMGFKLYIITGGKSQDVKDRLLGLGIHEVFLSSANKLKVYLELQQREGFADEQVLYMGDDLPDIPVLKQVGVSTCPQDAAPELKAFVDYQSPYNGGRFAVRDVIEQTMKVQGKWLVPEAFEW